MVAMGYAELPEILRDEMQAYMVEGSAVACKTSAGVQRIQADLMVCYHNYEASLREEMRLRESA